MNAPQQSRIGARLTNGDLTPCLSHEAVCPEEKGRGRGACVCVCFHVCFDGVKILGQALNAAPLIWGEEGWGVGEAPHRHTHTTDGMIPCAFTYLAALWAHGRTEALYMYSRIDHG